MYPELPDRIPVHFGAGGVADGWADRSVLSWFALPAIALLMNLLLYGAAAYASRNARFINLPDKERLLRLPPERQRPVLARVRAGLESIGVLLTAMFCLAQFASYRAAMGHDTRLLIVTILVLCVLSSPIVAIVLLLRVQTEIDRQARLERREDGDGAPAGPTPADGSGAPDRATPRGGGAGVLR